MHSPRAWQLPFRLPPLHWCWPTLWLILLILPVTSPCSSREFGTAAAGFLCTSAPVSQCSIPKREPWSVVLGAPPSTEGTEDLLRLKKMDSAIPVLMATLTQTPPWVATPGHTPASLMLPIPCASPLCWRHKRKPVCTCFPQGHTSCPVR